MRSDATALTKFRMHGFVGSIALKKDTAVSPLTLNCVTVVSARAAEADPISSMVLKNERIATTQVRQRRD
jgi:hypothetical protein